MNLKTTLVLVFLCAAGGVFYWLQSTGSPLLQSASRQKESSDQGTRSFLETELTAAKLSKIQVQHGGQQVILEHGQGDDWTMPGKWPTRKPEVDALVHLLTGLRSRFAPLPLGNPPDLKTYGLDQPEVTVTVRVDGKDHRLLFGEDPDETNRFSRATFVRLDDKAEVVRLAPGLVALLERPQDYYQQRRLFPSERVAKEEDAQEKVERLAAKSVTVNGPSSSYTLAQASEDWELRAPVHDRPDPDKLKSILTAVPDIWAEQFVDRPKKDLAEYGLKEPEQKIQVTRPTGDTVTLLIGKQSKMKTRNVMRAAPNFGGPPMPPQREVVHEEYRYAKLENNDQIFEIKADKLKDVFVTADSLRDAHLARFRTEDARRVELNQEGHEIVLVKQQDRWRLQKPLDTDAESSKITELLDKLSGLEARDKDVLDKADPKTYGLDKPAATVRVTVEQEIKGAGEAKTTKTKTWTFLLGKHDTEKNKLYARMDGWERINSIEDSVLKLVERPALAYRSRRVLDFSTADLAKIEVKRAGEQFTLEQTKGTWRLATPVQADIDSSKVFQLADDLGRLEAVEYISDAPTPKDLDQSYGLAQPALTAKTTFTDAKKPSQTLLVGKQRPGKQEYFAKLDSGPAVFTIKKESYETLSQASLAYRPLQLWQLSAEDIKELRLRKAGPEYSLKRDGQNWKIAGPFETPASVDLAKPMTDELANVRCERYAAHSAKDLKTYGLDKPYLRVALQEKEQGKPGEKPPPKERVLLIGSVTGKDAKTRYAKLGDGEAVFVIGDKLVSAVDHDALDLLDRNLLALDTRSIERMEVKGSGGPLTLERRTGDWMVIDSPTTPFPADSETIAGVLGVWANLRPQRFAAYGDKVKWADYGLDKAATQITVTVQAPAANGKTSKPVRHTLALGKPVEGSASERYARLDQGPGVLVLSAGVVGELTHNYLDFVNRSALKLDPNTIKALHRRMGGAELEIVNQSAEQRKKGAPEQGKVGREDEWQIVAPQQRADAPTLAALVADLASLRAKRVAAYPAKDLKPFGLDDPAAIFTLRSAGPNGKAIEHVIKIGRAEAGDRFAQVDNSTAVIVLPASLADRLTAPPLHFRDHNLARVSGVDRATLERGPRKAVFAKVDGTWKLTDPVDAEAEQTDLEDFLTGLRSLRADELVADKPADLKSYGLDRAEARWQFSSGDKTIATLLVGDHEKTKGKEGPRCYAKLAGGDLVFLLNPKMTTQVLAEYRSRTPWASLDAAQIEGLNYNYGNRTFVLEKADNEWHVAGKPGVKVNAEAIRETLDALAGLKVARYVVDKGGELKLYGLEPPQLALDIRTRSGNRTLHIGRHEGESKRYYARVPEGNNSAVFIISDTDGGRIVRLLGAFIQDSAKAAVSLP
jgi:hypothetical protein